MKMTDWLFADNKVWPILKGRAHIVHLVGLTNEYQICVFITFYLEGIDLNLFS